MKFRGARLSKMNAQKVFWSEFLEMYKSLPALWKKKSENYCNRVAKEAAYDKLVDKLKEIDPEANSIKVKKKIHIFRTNYRRELKKINTTHKSGADAADICQPTLWYFDLLHFLSDLEDHCEAKSTMSDADSVSDKSNEVFEPLVKQKKVKQGEFLKIACEKLKKSNDAVLSKVWASQYEDNMFWSEFLEMYKSLPVLWKVKSQSYCSRVAKAAAYDKLLDKLKEIDPEATRRKVIKKINTFRTGYKRELKKIEADKSGADADGAYQPTLWYFDLLTFLSDQEVHGEAKSTMSDDDSVSDGGNEVFKPPLKRRKVKEPGILKMACETLEESNDAVLTKVWTSQYADNVFWSEFLDMYKSLPVLWKVKSENYCNREAKAAAYDKLLDKLKEIDPEANMKKVKKKIHIFRTNYRRELKKMKTDKSGADADDAYQPTLWYFDLLHFLTDQEVHGDEMKSTMSDDDSVSDGGNEIFEEDEIPTMAGENLRECSDDISVLAEGWASQYAELINVQRVLARRIWADVLFHGCMNRLTEKIVEDIHNVLRGTSNTSTPTSTPLPSPTPYYEEHSYSPQPQFTFVAYEHSDETLISPTTKSDQLNLLGQNPSSVLPSTSSTHSLPSRSTVTNNEEIQRSSPTSTNLKEYINTFADANEYQDLSNNSDEIEENIEEVEYSYEDILYEVDDDDVIESIDHEDYSYDEIDNKNVVQNIEENCTPNATKVAVSILDYVREEKLQSDTRRTYINWKKLNDDERRELKRLQRKRDCVCDQCGRHFTDTSNLKLHLLRHTGIKNYECRECNAKFYTPHLLKRHSLMHKNSPPMFACQYCERKYFSNDLRLQHERSHFKERPFNCQYCAKAFFSKPLLKEHELVHTRIRKYHCELCDHHFLRRTHLRRHYHSKIHKNMEQQKK